MTAADLVSYFITVLTISVAPGPVVLMMVARAASRDGIGAAGFGLGSALGGVAIVSLVCLGFSNWLSDRPEIFIYSKYAMLAYLLWIARGILRRGIHIDTAVKARQKGFWPATLAGVLTCFLSPYYMILFPLVLPEVLDMTHIDMPDFMILSATTFAAFSCGAAGIVIFGAQIARLVKTPAHVQRMNRALAALLVFGGSWMALS